MENQSQFKDKFQMDNKEMWYTSVAKLIQMIFE